MAAVLVAGVVSGLLASCGASHAANATTSSTSTTVADAPTSSVPPSSSSTTSTLPSCKVRLAGPHGAIATFHTCPPPRVLLIGDSVGLTLGLQLVLGEIRRGVLVDDAAVLGCGFIAGDQVEPADTFISQPASCDNQLSAWEAEVKSFKPRVVVIEMGWWDSMAHLLPNGAVESPGQATYDSQLQSAMDTYAHAFTAAGLKLVFLTVPWMDPTKFTNGAASATVHNLINSMLSTAAASAGGSASVFDIAPYVTPAGHFETTVDGDTCRESDGVHFYHGQGFTFNLSGCGKALNAVLLPYLIKLAGS